MLTMVVARYKENVAWLNDAPSHAKIVLYNKGPRIDSEAFQREVTVVELPNAGREAGTYMHHLMHRFRPSEGEFTVFTQADPFEHAPHFLELLHEWQRWKDVQPLSIQWIAKKQIPPPSLLFRERADWIDQLAIRREHFSLTTWAPVGFLDTGAWGIGNEYRQKHGLANGVNLMAHFLEFMGLDDIAARARPSQLGTFSYGAIFAIRNSRIASFVRDERRHLEKMELLTRADLNYGYMFERVWLHLFGEPFILLNGGANGEGDSALVRRDPEQLRADAFALISRGHYEQAAAALNDALLLAPDEHELMCDLAALSLRRGDLQAAIFQSRRALSANGASDSALFTLGIAQKQAGDAAQARKALLALTQGERGATFKRTQPALYDVALKYCAMEAEPTPSMA